MLALTKKVEYGLIALSHLALHRDRVATAREMAERYRVPSALLMNVLKTLAQHGVVRSSRGSKGGYELAQEPRDITLDALVTAIEGPVRLAQCVEAEHMAANERCDLECGCPISGSVKRLHRKLRDFLGEVTLAEIAGDGQGGACKCSESVQVALAMTGRS